FLPAAGYYHNEGFYEKGEVCSYWLNELSRGGDNTMAYCLTAYYDYRSWAIRKRSSGRPIRPVAIPLTEVCDLNEDGKVTVADLAELIQKSLPPPSLRGREPRSRWKVASMQLPPFREGGGRVFRGRVFFLCSIGRCPGEERSRSD
ncbi:MAG: hypothetical protein KBT12_08735, partial [Bacteroidales bacterium]|nr:hypothetical protein [Candidatus Physcousia equi]